MMMVWIKKVEVGIREVDGFKIYLSIKFMGIGEGLDMRGERVWDIKENFKVFILSNW